jgi:hypothetical protein
VNIFALTSVHPDGTKIWTISNTCQRIDQHTTSACTLGLLAAIQGEASRPPGVPGENELVTFWEIGLRERRRERITSNGIQSFTVLVAVLVNRMVCQNDQVIARRPLGWAKMRVVTFFGRELG